MGHQVAKFRNRVPSAPDSDRFPLMVWLLVLFKKEKKGDEFM